MLIARNTVDGNLQCKETRPAPTGGDNIVHGNKGRPVRGGSEPAPSSAGVDELVDALNDGAETAVGLGGAQPASSCAGLVRHTSSVIAATSGAVAIGDLSVAAGVSSTHLAQRFKELIGVTPKRLARTYRFAATVFAINPAGPIDWGDLAGGAGYFDQAHFGHEFRAFTGLTPTRYVEVRRRFLREHPGHALDGWPLPAD